MNLWISYTLCSRGFQMTVDEEEAKRLDADPEYASDFLGNALRDEGIDLSDVADAALLNDDTGAALVEWY